MTAKIISCVIVAIINVLIAFFAFAFMIVAMNGFNDATSSWGIFLYIILQVVFILLAMIIVFFLVGFVQNKWEFSSVVASLISVGISVVIGLIFTIVSFFAGIIAASIAWQNR